MPYLMDITYVPTWAKNPQDNANHLSSLHSKNPRVISKYKVVDKEWDIFSVKSDDSEEVWVEFDGLIKYHVEVETFDLVFPNKTHRMVGQTSVWRDKTFSKIPKVAKFVFLNILFPRYHAVITDYRQSTDGKDFWSYRVLEALETGLYVYGVEGYDQPRITVESIEQLTHDNLDDYYTSGTDFDGEFRRILITDKPIIFN